MRRLLRAIGLRGDNIEEIGRDVWKRHVQGPVWVEGAQIVLRVDRPSCRKTPLVETGDAILERLRQVSRNKEEC